MAPTQDNAVLDRLLGPRLGYVMPRWPQQAWEGLCDMAERSSLSAASLGALLRERPDDPRWDRLVHLACIGYTSFYRHAEQLSRLQEELRDWQGAGPVWIWCAGCASGEEAYSLALCAAETGADVRIVATDVDAEAVAFAERGFYPASRTEGLPNHPPRTDWQAPDTLRARVRFEHGSLTEGAPAPGQFHYIFCRNVMVYFGTRRRLHLDRLAGYLRPRGRLLVAPTEALGELPDDMLREQPLGWLSQLPDTGPASSIRPAPGAMRPEASAPQRRMRRETAPLATPEMEDTLQCTALWSAEGELSKAEEALRDTLAKAPEDAVSWFLLGDVLNQAGELSDAREAFTQATHKPVPEGAHVEADTLQLAAHHRAARLPSAQ